MLDELDGKNIGPHTYTSAKFKVCLEFRLCKLLFGLKCIHKVSLGNKKDIKVQSILLPKIEDPICTFVLLIKSITRTIPQYLMICFSLPINLTYELQSMINQFWCGDMTNNRRIHWLNGDHLNRAMSWGYGIQKFTAF